MNTSMTLKDTDLHEAKLRNAVWKRDRAQQELNSAQASLKSIEAKLAVPDPSLTAIESVLTLVNDLPAGLIARGSGIRAGGWNLREVIKEELAIAAAQQRDKRVLLESSLATAQERLLKAEENFALRQGLLDEIAV